VTAVVQLAERQAAARNGRGLEVILSSADSGGTLAVVACSVPAGTAGPPLHRHPGSDETFIVTDGTLLVWAEGRVSEVGAGGLVHVSRGTPHTFAAQPGAGARFLTLHTPGGFEGFHVAAAAAERAAGGPVPTADLIRLAAGFDWELAGPPLLPSGELAPVPG
jgi:quercetin dioxygenase-like cupin family protein